MSKVRYISSKLLCCLLVGIWCIGLLVYGLPTEAAQKESDFSYFTQGPTISFHDFFDFERGYVNWKEITADGEKVLQITKGPLYTVQDMPEKYTISFMARSTEDYLSVKMTAGFKRSNAAESSVLLDGPTNNVVLVADSEAFAKGKAYKNSGYDEGSRNGIYLEYPGWLNKNEWYGITLIADGDFLHVFVNGEFIYSIEDEDGFGGCFVLRSNNNKALQLKNLKYTAGASDTVYAGTKAVGTVDHSNVIYPGKSETFTYRPVSENAGSVAVAIADSNGVVYETGNLSAKDNKYTYTFIPRGKAGCQTVTLTQDGEKVVFRFYLQHITEVITGDESFDFFYNMLQTQLLTWPEGDVYQLKSGERVRTSVGWIRDDAFSLEGSKYLASTSASWIDFYLSQQREDGMLFEKIEAKQTPQTYYYYLPRDCYKYVEEGIGGVCRLDVEADVEFLLVQAAYQTWQASGDDTWMKEILPGLDKAMTYIRTDKTRWSSKYGLAIRANTIDTWDYYYTNEHRAVSPWWEPKAGFSKTAMCVFYGDNTGYYQAACQLAEMYRVVGNDTRMNYWLNEAQNVRTNLMETAWNGNYFAHMVHIDPTPEEADARMQEDFEKDWERLSLSLTYTLNRNFLTQEEGEKIIEAFRNFRDNPPAIEGKTGAATDENYFAEWVTIYPAYLNGFGGATSIGNGMNASLCSFGAGALSRGSYIYGYADYGTNILERLKDLCVRDGQIHFVYYRDGSVLPGVGPAVWGAGSIYAAITEGLTGIRDGGDQYLYATVAPAWTSTSYDEVYTTTSYGASDAYVAYTMKHDKATSTVRYTLVGDSETMHLQMLVPTGNIPKAVQINGKSVSFDMKAAAEDVWAFVRLEDCSNTEVYDIEVSYEEGTAPQAAFDFEIPALGDTIISDGPGGDIPKAQIASDYTLYIVIGLIGLVVLCVVATTVVVVVKRK